MEKENIGILFVILDSPKSLPMARARIIETYLSTRLIFRLYINYI